MDKFTSRKYVLALIITIALIVFVGIAFIYAFVNKDYKWALDMMPFLVYTEAVYVGGNVAQDFSPLAKGTSSGTSKK